jgi:ABC-type Mn2+/Zn2+ transport system permease subunit
MRKMSLISIVAGIVAGILGLISRAEVPVMTNPRVWAGAAVILLLLAIAINTLPSKQG